MIIEENERKNDIERTISIFPLNTHLITFNYNEFLSMALYREFNIVSEVIKHNIIPGGNRGLLQVDGTCWIMKG